MKAQFSKFTGGNPRLMVAPTVWAFIENLCTMLPSIFSMLAIGQLLVLLHQLRLEVSGAVARH